MQAKEKLELYQAKVVRLSIENAKAQALTRPSGRPRRILITGGSRGIGLATAKVLASCGNKVVLAAKSRENLENAASQIAAVGHEPELLQVDLTNPVDVSESANRVLASGEVDVLINCAGSLSQGLMLNQGDNQLVEEMTLNYLGPIRMTRALLPRMLEVGSGAIVNVSSMLAKVATPTTANYSASKAALEAFSLALKGEVEGRGIRVVVFVAPHTRTELGASVEFRGIRNFDVEFVGRELARSVDSRNFIHCAGPYVRVGRTLAHWMPGFMRGKLSASVAHLVEPASTQLL